MTESRSRFETLADSSARQEIMKTYFVAVDDVKDPSAPFNPELSPFWGRNMDSEPAESVGPY